LAKEISKQTAGEKIDVIGFSIGAFIARQTCRYLANEVKNLHLISAAAPLEAGDFLDTMAGKQVFRLAKAFPVLFVLLSYWQGLLALLFPNALFLRSIKGVVKMGERLTAFVHLHGSLLHRHKSITATKPTLYKVAWINLISCFPRLI
jgi:pimeloyl-ACP methyl ester carboxylesterase